MKHLSMLELRHLHNCPNCLLRWFEVNKEKNDEWKRLFHYKEAKK